MRAGGLDAAGHAGLAGELVGVLDGGGVAAGLPGEARGRQEEEALLAGPDVVNEDLVLLDGVPDVERDARLELVVLLDARDLIKGVRWVQEGIEARATMELNLLMR